MRTCTERRICKITISVLPNTGIFFAYLCKKKEEKEKCYPNYINMRANLKKGMDSTNARTFPLMHNELAKNICDS